MLGVRLEPELEAQVQRVARQRRMSKSQLVREAVQIHLKGIDEAYRAACRAQSLAVAEIGVDEAEDWAFWETLGDEVVADDPVPPYEGEL